MMLRYVATLVSTLATVLSIAIVIRALLSWFPIDRRNGLVVILDQITEPVLAPLRKVIPLVGMIDITPLVAILLLSLIQQMAANLARF